LSRSNACIYTGIVLFAVLKTILPRHLYRYLVDGVK